MLNRAPSRLSKAEGEAEARGVSLAPYLLLPKELVAELDQEDVGRVGREGVEELVGGALVEGRTPGEVEGIDGGIALARLRPHEKERRAGPVLPAQHGVGLEAGEGKVASFGVGIERRQRVAIFEQREVLVLAARGEHLAVELDRERGREREVAAQRQVHRAGIALAEDGQVEPPLVVIRRCGGEEGVELSAVVERQEDGVGLRLAAFFADAPAAVEFAEGFVRGPGRHPGIPAVAHAGREVEARIDVPFRTKAEVIVVAAVVEDFKVYIRLHLPRPAGVRFVGGADAEFTGLRSGAEAACFVDVVAAEEIVTL